MNFAKPHLRALTGLRFIAAIHVVLFHAFPRRWLEGHAWLEAVIDRGPASVSLFFMLSGFILTYTYFDSFGKPAIRKKKFFKARFARIYPVYFLSILIALPYPMVALYRELGPDTWGLIAGFAEKVLPMAFLVHVWHPDTVWGINAAAWSLSVEAFFYIVFPLFAASAFVARAVQRPWLCMAILYLAAIGPPLAYFNSEAISGVVHELVLAYNPVLRLPDFLFGIVLGDLFLRKKGWDPAGLSERSRKVYAVLPVVALIGIAAFFIVAEGMPGPMVRTLVLPLFAILIWGLAYGQGLFCQSLSTRSMVLLGGASYSVYILHLPLFLIWLSICSRLFGWEDGQAALELTYLVFVVVVSIAVFRFVEEPMRSYIKSRFT